MSRETQALPLPTSPPPCSSTVPPHATTLTASACKEDRDVLTWGQSSSFQRSFSLGIYPTAAYAYYIEIHIYLSYTRSTSTKLQCWQGSGLRKPLPLATHPHFSHPGSKKQHILILAAAQSQPLIHLYYTLKQRLLGNNGLKFPRASSVGKHL